MFIKEYIKDIESDINIFAEINMRELISGLRGLS